jgi:fatty acid desaturase
MADGRFVSRRDMAHCAIPGRLNLSLVALQMLAAFAILAAASHTHSRYLLAIGFAFVMQMGFCLAHEAVHRNVHPNRNINVGAGVLVLLLFPGNLHFCEVEHLLQHRGDRFNDELEDYVLPGENSWIKRIMYYLLISVLFWLLLSVSSIVVAVIPSSRIRLPHPDKQAGAFCKFVQFLNGVKLGRVRRDLLVSAVVWAAAFPLLRLRLSSVAVCYAAFGFSWASQQFFYHVRTLRHAVLGALDLKLWGSLRWLHLSSNYHLTHDLAVWVPWNLLPSIAPQYPKCGYLTTYMHLWQPAESRKMRGLLNTRRLGRCHPRWNVCVA